MGERRTRVRDASCHILQRRDIDFNRVVIRQATVLSRPVVIAYRKNYAPGRNDRGHRSKGCAALADDRVIAVGQSFDEVVAAGLSGGLDDLLVGGVGAAELYVVLDRAGKEIDVLEWRGSLSRRIPSRYQSGRR